MQRMLIENFFFKNSDELRNYLINKNYQYLVAMTRADQYTSTYLSNKTFIKDIKGSISNYVNNSKSGVKNGSCVSHGKIFVYKQEHDVNLKHTCYVCGSDKNLAPNCKS